MSLTVPDHYDPHMTVRETENAIKFIRDLFQKEFGKEMNLERISAPLFVSQSSGFNDNLNGVERPVAFDMKSIPGETFEVVQSLAKWKRAALGEYGFHPGEGLYTNMNAIRRDEDLDQLHSCYVDQWDWEMVIREEDRTEEFLRDVVRRIYHIIKHTQNEVWYRWPDAVYRLPEDIVFVTTEELEQRWPDKSRKEREALIAHEHGAVFIEHIGWPLVDGKPHDGRAPDYDDWKLNGDIVFWFEPLGCALEVSSMGIRVSPDSLKEQLKASNCEYRMEFPYHRSLADGKLPLTIGGGIGQSRLCMLLLGRVHVGEVQASIWPDQMRAECAEKNIILL